MCWPNPPSLVLDISLDPKLDISISISNWDHTHGRIRLDRSSHHCIRIRYGPWLGWCLLMALIPPLHSYPIWKPWPGLDKASFIMHICSAIMDMGPGPKDQAIPAKVHIGYECNGRMRARSKRHPSQGPYRIWATMRFVVTK